MIAIFSFEIGDYLRDEKKNLLVFETQGMASQYLQKWYHKPVPVTRTKRIIQYPNYYQAPLDFIRFVRREVLMVKNEDDVLYTGRLYLFDIIPLWKRQRPSENGNKLKWRCHQEIKW